MPQPQRCSSFPYLRRPIRSMVAGSEDTHDFEELDPSGRYGRYKDILGKGAFKVVYKGFDIVEGIEVAWNQIKVQNSRHSLKDIQRFYSEVHLLKSLKHKNIIKFYHSWVDTEAMNINFLTEMFTSGTLRMYGKRHKCIDIRALKKWSRQILRGLLYLHSQDPPIIHRDLKCDNIFINGNQGEVKIGDLGLATILNQARAGHSVIGTPEFMAPELYEEEYTELVDIYSFGLCLLEVVTGEYPYSECANAAQIYRKVTSGKKPAALDKITNLELRSFVEKCIAPASKRLPARDLLMDVFLQEDEVCRRTGERESIHNGSYGITSINGSLSDIQPFLGCRSLLSADSFSSPGSSASLPDIYHDYTPSPTVDLSPDSAPSCKRIAQRKLRTAYLIQDKVGQKIEVQIKGRQVNDSIVQIWLRAVKSEGQIRVINFPFDVKHDTPMSVARELIAALDLVNQDENVVAELFDHAIGVIVPGWHACSSTDSTEIPHVMGGGSMPWQLKPSDAALKQSETEPIMDRQFQQIPYRHNQAWRHIQPLAGRDEGRAPTSVSSEESWDSLHSSSLGQSLDMEGSFESSPSHDLLRTMLISEFKDLEERTNSGLGNENGALHAGVFHDGNIGDCNVARTRHPPDYNVAASQMKELALLRGGR